MGLIKTLEDGTLFYSVEKEAISPPLLLDTLLTSQNLGITVQSEAEDF